jgi:hypothetical protein
VPVTAGVGNQDDSGNRPESQTQSEANTQSVGLLSNDSPIQPQPNALDQYANYTWSASVYMVTPEQLQRFQNSQRKSVNGYNLLFQSGGASNNTNGPQSPTNITTGAAVADDTVLLNGVQDGRNPFFDLDFYIDAITIKNNLPGKATMAAHSIFDLKFTVIEPNNITLINRLYEAAQDLKPQDAVGAINYAAVSYLMVLRFYGYDVNGQIVTARGAQDQVSLTDPRAVIEKYIPFRIRQINWSVGNQAVSYEFDCQALGQNIGFGTRRNTIPADVEISGGTVESLLTAEITYSSATPSPATPGSSTTVIRNDTAQQTDPGAVPSVTVRDRQQTDPGFVPSSPPKASSAPSKTVIKTGLVKSLNNIQQQLVTDGIYDIADIYEISLHESIAQATITKPGKKKSKKFSGSGPSPAQDPSRLSEDKQNMNIATRNMSLYAGMPLLQAIELIVRNSSYITNQASIEIDEITGELKPTPNSDAIGVNWFNILVDAVPIGYDFKRNDYAYRIRFSVVPYRLQKLDSIYFPPARFRGVHKKYPWWFTGENMAVLDYSASFNKAYQLTVSGSPLEGNQLDLIRQRSVTSMQEISFRQFQARSTESDNFADTRANELGANAAEYLYNPSDNANATIRIIGDPAWIAQGASLYGADAVTFATAPFNSDGSINFDSDQVLFEIVWQKPEDYDLQTGKADPYSRTSKLTGTRNPIQSVIYLARIVTSEFRQGRFEQVIEGTLYEFLLDDGRNKAESAEINVSTASEAAREPASGAPGRLQSSALGQGLLPGAVGARGLELPAISNPIGSVGNQFTDAAKLLSSGGTGLRIPNPVAAALPTKNLNLPSVTSALDTAALSGVALAPTSDGQNVDLNLVAPPKLFGRTGFGVESALQIGTSDSNLVYTGSDYIVWNRINSERLNRGLPGLADIGYPQPAPDAVEPQQSYNSTTTPGPQTISRET